MKNKVLGWIGVIWGGLVLLSGFVKMSSGGVGGGAYGAGQVAGFVIGGLLCLAGVYTLRKKPKA